ncbi:MULTISPECIES: imidazole glycerol phosphate synthase subunit HisF [Shewanella]|uniref:imidazole glycerol-phosphate synthase n=1 Tax=Shewanella vaxholmensis TaxID=3063535 RepID=A0ABU9UNU8_9GAMM|nr:MULTISPECIES: imidazole glycerol phosphate synthase cyclase subunit [Shewanella]MDT3306366.1 imidazole glycerol phosphate synthase cyclase subunit [Shewanella sp. SP1S1-4]RBP77384.1 cyclase [Shewanella putrefaciens]WVI94697.1 imidazole glycerol phosphate synthase cyclase subunit [Shewanella oncorhynchi]GCF91224.1 putative imidazole glycerol phosphate synthase subunit hisF2 [Shewanella sp. M-Br]
MLRKRIIPIVLLDGFSVLKTINFNVRRNLGSPITVAKTYNTRNVDELVLLDIDASKQGRSIDKFTIAEIAQECFMPLTVGGGIRTIKDIRDLLAKGADKISINSYALENPDFIKEASDIFGAQCVVVSIDVIEDGGNFYIYNKGVILRDLDLIEWIQMVEKLGAGEILVNNVSRDGTMIGANIHLAELVSDSVFIPVIYAGGVSSPIDAALVAETKISGIGIASIFHFTDYTPDDCRNALKAKLIPVR